MEDASTHVAGRARTDLVLGSAWLLLTVVIQLGLSYFLPQVGQSLTDPALVVAATGLLLPLLGLLLASSLNNQYQLKMGRAVFTLLWLGSVVLPIVGFLWVAPGFISGAALPIGGTVLAIEAVLFVLLLIPAVRTETAFRLRTALALFAASAALVGLVASFGTVPNGLSLQFRVRDEARLDRLLRLARSEVNRAHARDGDCISPKNFPSLPVFGSVSEICVGGGYAYFQAQASPYSFDYQSSGTPGADSCVIHLDGPWWEASASQGGVFCPGGWTFVPGG